MGLMPDERRLPGWSVVNNLPCNAGYTGLICGRGTKIAHAVEQPSVHVTTTEPTLWSLCATTRACTLAPKMRHDTTKTQRAEAKTQCSQTSKRRNQTPGLLCLPPEDTVTTCHLQTRTRAHQELNQLAPCHGPPNLQKPAGNVCLLSVLFCYISLNRLRQLCSNGTFIHQSRMQARFAQIGSKQEKEYVKAVHCHPAYLTYMQSTS